MDSNGNRRLRVRNHRKRISGEMAMRTGSMVMTIRNLADRGYPESILRQIARSDRFEEVGFATGDKRKTYYFFVEKLDEFLKKGDWKWN